MVQRVPWERDEAIIMLDALVDVLNREISRNEAICAVSSELRNRAKQSGDAIDHVYRNVNGITLQMSIMEYIFTNGQHGLKKPSMPKLFQDVVDLYKNDYQTYKKLLTQAKMIPVIKSVQDQFLAWLGTQVSPTQLSELKVVYADIESFCIQRKILKMKLFETTKPEVIKKVVDTVNSNKVFRFTYKRNLNKMITAIKYYYRYVKEHPEQVKPEIKPQHHVVRNEVTVFVAEPEAKEYTIDFTTSEGISFTKPIPFSYFGNEQSNIEETRSRYTNILTKYFGEDGYQLGRSIFRGRFKRYYSIEYGCDISESDERIDVILEQIGTQRDGRIFPQHDEDQSGLIEDIISDIISALNEGASAVYIEAVYKKYQKQLADSLQIYHLDALTQLLIVNAKGRYSKKYSYLTRGSNNADSRGDLLRIMKGFHHPKDYKSIHAKAWYIPYDKMKSLLVVDKSIVNVSAGTYFYSPNLPVSAEEIHQLIIAIQIELEYRSHITDVEMMELIRYKCPSIAINTEEYTTYGLRNCLGYILRDKFSFNGPIISSIGSQLSMSDIYTEFAKMHENLSFNDLKNLSNEMNISIYWDCVLSEMVRVSEKELVRRDLIQFDIDSIDTVLDGMCPGNYLPLKQISMFLHFPNIGYQWNNYILESYLFSGSLKFKLMHVSFGQNSVCGAMVRIDSPITDYRTLIVDVLANSNSLGSTNDALQYIVDQGYQQRRRYDGIEQLIQEAKLIKEQKEKIGK